MPEGLPVPILEKSVNNLNEMSVEYFRAVVEATGGMPEGTAVVVDKNGRLVITNSTEIINNAAESGGNITPLS